jgi:transposase
MEQVQTKWKTLKRNEKVRLQTDSMRHRNGQYLMRCKIIRNLVRGYGPASIHCHLGCSESQVYRIAHRFVEEGLPGLADKREDNGTRKVGDQVEWVVLLGVAGSPQDFGYRRPTWTQELLVKLVGEQTGIPLSCSTMSRLLKRLEVGLCRAKPTVGCPWKEARRKRRIRELRRIIRDLPDGEVVVYVDEVDIHLNPKIGPDWTIRGLRKTVVTPGKNKKHYLAGALNAKTGELTWVESEYKDSYLFIDLLWTLVQEAYPEAKCIHLILDNYGIHDSHQTRLAREALKDRVKFHFLPPYCPDDNRIERLWKDLHDNVTRNHRCSDMDELMIEVRWYLNDRNHALTHLDPQLL